MSFQKYIGVDGCRAGWFYVCINNLGECDFGVFKTLPELWQANKKNTLILVDIPIGLPSKNNPSRECDTQARKLLRPLRHSSVFSPPCRETLSKATYADACDINAAVTGRKISQQTWNIASKIREVDNLLQHHPKARAVIRECHPEICFYGLNSGSPMKYYKKHAKGQEERIELLNCYFGKSRAIFKAAQGRFLRKEVARDDILDALVAVVTGFLSKGNLATLPEKPGKDELGLPMEMAYCDVQPNEFGRRHLDHGDFWSPERYMIAFKFAAEAHQKIDQKVPGSDLPYICHVALVAMEVMGALSSNFKGNADLSVQCALLHDTLEDTEVAYADLKAQFGKQVADGVQALTKNSKLESKPARMADSLARIRKQPKEIWMVKMSDRITNLQPPPEYWDNEKRNKYLKEAREIHDALKDASPYLSARLSEKIEAYKKYCSD